MNHGIIIPSVILLLAAVYLFLIKPRMGKKIPVELTAADYAHRGLFDNENGDGENTLSAFAAASAAGYGIELDVRLSCDGEVVVFHDNTLERLCGRTERVDSLSAAELAEIRIGKNQGKIPLFEEVLAVIDRKTPLCVELKGDSTDTTLCGKVADILDRYDGLYSVESFNPFLLNWFRKNRPDCVRGQLVTNLFRQKGAAFGTSLACTPMLLNCISRPDYISCDVRFRRSISVVICEKLFRAVMFAWTVDTEEKYEDAAARGDIPIFQDILPAVPPESKK